MAKGQTISLTSMRKVMGGSLQAEAMAQAMLARLRQGEREPAQAQTGEVMPVKIRKLKGGKVRVTTPGGVKAKRTTVAKAKRQANLLRAIDHGWKPSKRRRK